MDVKKPQLSGVGGIRLDSVFLSTTCVWQAGGDYGKAEGDVKRFEFRFSYNAAMMPAPFT